MKKKGDKWGPKNPPIPPEFKDHEFTRADKNLGEISPKPTSVKLFVEDEAALADRFPDPKEKAAWLRSLIHEALG